MVSGRSFRFGLWVAFFFPFFPFFPVLFAGFVLFFVLGLIFILVFPIARVQIAAFSGLRCSRHGMISCAESGEE